MRKIFPLAIVVIAYAIFSHAFADMNAEDSSEGSGRGPASYMNEGSGLQGDPEIDKRIVESDKLLSEDITKSEEEPVLIPVEINNRVAMWIRYYTERERDRTIRYFSRAAAYRKQVERLLEQNDVPKEIFYLAMVESGFTTSARSHAHAVGVWQLIPGTARNYGLKINSYVDERKSWIKSTETAITYLKDLKNVFGSWYLAFAAYNAGEYRIVRSIMAGKTRDFWALAEGKMLPTETLNYVPKIMAAMIIGKNPDKYNIFFTPDEDWGEFESVEAPSGTSLKDLARVTGISVDTFRKWNQDIAKGLIPYDRSGKFEIYLPKSEIAKYEAKQDMIAGLRRDRFTKLAMNDFAREYAIYVVRRGDTLSAISRTLGISIRTLKKLNRLSHNRLHPGQRLRYYTSLAKIQAVRLERDLATAKKKKR